MNMILMVFMLGKEAVFDMMTGMKRETCGQEPQVRSQNDTLVILDRGVLKSTLPTQLMYEGLIDEIFGTQCASMRLPEDKTVHLSS